MYNKGADPVTLFDSLAKYPGL